VDIQLNKTEVVLNKPMHVGFSVLDISKTCLYRFHYDVMPKLVGDDKFSLLYMDTDTDSLIYSIETDDIYRKIKANIEHFDTSDFPNPNDMPRVNKKIVGLMKNECSGEPMAEFVGLRSKMYSLRVNGEDNLKKCKGVKYGVVQRSIHFDDYKRCLDENSVEPREQRTVVSRAHRVYTIQQCKITVSPFDDKRFLVPDSKVETLSWGHYQSSDREDVIDIDGHPINAAGNVNNGPILNDNIDHEDADTQQPKGILKRELANDVGRKRNRDDDLQNTIVGGAQSMIVDDDDFDLQKCLLQFCSLPKKFGPNCCFGLEWRSYPSFPFQSENCAIACYASSNRWLVVQKFQIWGMKCQPMIGKS